jgi:hypothetical protein
MATQLASRHQPVRVIRSAASTYTDRPAQPWLADRQPGPARRLKEFASATSCNRIQTRPTPPPATERRGGTTGPRGSATTQRSLSRASVSWCLARINRMAHRICSGHAAVPEHRFVGARQINRSGCSRCPAVRSGLGRRTADLARRPSASSVTQRDSHYEHGVVSDRRIRAGGNFFNVAWRGAQNIQISTASVSQVGQAGCTPRRRFRGSGHQGQVRW